MQQYKSCSPSELVSCLCKWGQNLLLDRVVGWMKCGTHKVLYPITVHSRPPDEYQISSPCTQAARASTGPGSQLSCPLGSGSFPVLPVFPLVSAAQGYSCWPPLASALERGWCPVLPPKPDQRSHQQDAGVPTACFSLSPAGPLELPEAGEEGLFW